MKSSFLVLGPLAAILLTSALFAGQRTVKPTTEPPLGGGSACAADGADCIFGNAGGCVVYCEPGKKPECESAGCFLGFPHSAKCSCH